MEFPQIPMICKIMKFVFFQIDSRKKSDAEQLTKLEEQRLHYLRQVGNLLHPSVVVHDDEDNNEIVRTFGDIEVYVKR